MRTRNKAVEPSSAMQTILDALPSRLIAARWIKANILAALISGALSFILYGARAAVGRDDAGLATIVFLYAVAIVLAVLSGAAAGVLTGAVLQRIVPLLPVRSWIALNVAMDVVVAIASEMGQTVESGETPSMREMVVLGLVAGAALGFISGALQALVLRRAAEGTAAWIGWSAVAGAIGMSVIGAAMIHAPNSGLAGELSGQVFGLALNGVVAFAMLPALGQLRPRSPVMR